MKKVLLLSFYLFSTLSLLLASCDKKESQEPEPKQASMTAMVDGVDWTANQTGYSISNGIAGIAGSVPQAQTIILTLSEFKEGIIPLEFNGTSVGAVTNGTFVVNY